MVVAAVIAASAVAARDGTPAGAVARFGLRVSGNHLISLAGGAPVRLLGVDRSGAEYECTNAGDSTVFDGPTDAASIRAITNWHADAVRVPLNEDCWLGINGSAPRLSGSAYRRAVQRYVAALTTPVVTGEFGESGCTDGYAVSYMAWADTHAISYLGWAWDATSGGWSCSNGPSLIVDYSGRPTAYGVGLHDHLAALGG